MVSGKTFAISILLCIMSSVMPVAIFILMFLILIILSPDEGKTFLNMRSEIREKSFSPEKLLSESQNIMAAQNQLDLDALNTFVETQWNDNIIPSLCDFIRIPNQSPAYDKDWAINGHMDAVIKLWLDWAQAQNIEGLQIREVNLGRGLGEFTPCLFTQISATPGQEGRQPVLLYQHGDKQPPLDNWNEGLGPYTPLVDGDKLWGRGGADDGYGFYATLMAVKALQVQGVPHGRVLLFTEFCEESGSEGLDKYIEHLSDEIGDIGLIICLDSGAADYERLWLTTSLRGVMSGTLTVKVLKEGMHSGAASGVVPSSFNIMRILLDRLSIHKSEDPECTCLPEFLHTEIPLYRQEEARATAQIVGADFLKGYPFLPGVKTCNYETDVAELILEKTWMPTLSITGAAGLPPLEQAGNVLRPFTSLRLSFRLPPGVESKTALAQVKELLESNPPYGAHVSFHDTSDDTGFNAPDLSDKWKSLMDQASQEFWGQPLGLFGEGGSIPFLRLLQVLYPSTQFAVMGVLGPNSNAHGPNEFLHIPYAKKITMTVAKLLAAP
jgi:acetylornithine deacetylase/succinyl-diaminopimelate desuccinylase-like protein